MPLREDLLTPIPGENPSGANLRYDPVYDKIKEARREEEDLAQGAWQHDRKVADWPQVIKLTQEVIATRSKDLQLAVWLAEALLKKEGYGSFRDSLVLCRGLLENFWDTVHPEAEDGDLELRAAPLDWLGTGLMDSVKMVPLTRDGYGWYKYTESRTVGYEDQAKGDQAKKERDKKLKEGKLAPEDFDKSFTETPKVVYAQGEKNLDGCLDSLKALDKLCEEKFQDAAPSFSRLKAALEEVRHTVHGLLDKKRETEPDPVEEVPAEEAAGVEGAAEGVAAEGGAGKIRVGLVIPAASTEPAERRDAIAAVATTAAFLRKREPTSPAPYLMMRGLRWGELRVAAETNDPSLLEAPPTEVRQYIKSLAVQNKWAELLDAAENAMSLPCSRGWLDLQRMVVEACVGLGSDYDLIAKAIRTELRALLRDVPQLPQMTLMDETPAANAETQAWLRELMEEPAVAETPGKTASGPVADGEPVAGWKRKFIDSYQLAAEAIRKGQQGEAIEILQREIERQRSGRGRFLRRLQLVEICIQAGKEAIAQPILDEIASAIETHKLEEWEDREMVAKALLTILKTSTRIQGDNKEKQKMFDRICRLNPARALEI